MTDYLMNGLIKGLALAALAGLLLGVLLRCTGTLLIDAIITLEE
jgi:hypothetical protein